MGNYYVYTNSQLHDMWPKMCNKSWGIIEQEMWRTWSWPREIMRRINVSFLQQHASWLGQLVSPFILVMLLSEPCRRRVMTTLVRPNVVCLRLNDRNVECVCAAGGINFFHSVLYVSMPFLVVPWNSMFSLLPWNRELSPPPPPLSEC